MNNPISQKLADILQFSGEEARRLRSDRIHPEHLALGMLREGEGRAVQILKDLNVDLRFLKEELEHFLRRRYGNCPPPMDLKDAADPETEKILRMSVLEAKLTRSATTDTEHLLLALLHERKNEMAQILEFQGVIYEMVLDQIRPIDLTAEDGLGGLEDDEDEEEDEQFAHAGGGAPRGQSGPAPKPRTEKQQQGTGTPALDTFGTDMTWLAAEGRLDPVVGREKEINRLAQILSRRKKNNPALIGEPGVGKSAIVEGLALRIVEHQVSPVLFGKRLVMLDMAAVVAGTKYRGQFEERVRTILNELKKNPHIIVFIDEVHTLVGAGSASGTMDAANLLKPALARGEIQCIGATTLDEYRKSIEKDGALERRLQKEMVEPTTPEETLQILRNIKEKYEEHHSVTYTDAALEACVRLTERYITDRKFPDKAIDALDEAGSRARLAGITVPRELADEEKLIEAIRQLKLQNVKEQNYESAASCRDQELEHCARFEEMKRRWEEERRNKTETVDEDLVAETVSMMSGVPVQRMLQSEGMRLKQMEETLLGKIVGQDSAVRTVVKAIRRGRVGLKDPNKPIGTFLFLGPTGVGKTYLTKQLAEELFGSPQALIRIDMSEFMDKHTASKLVGAPPGYVGYEEGGQFTEKVRRKPYSIVLLDEIEKAHPDIFNLLLQVMDEGRLTDNNGRTVDFRNTVIILTSNVGTRQLKEFGQGVGFAARLRADSKEYDHSVIRKALDKTFAPEFLNRLDEIVMFEQLDEPALERITELELKGLYARIEALGYHLDIDEEAKRFVARKGYDRQFGARPLKRAIQTWLEDGLSELIVNEQPAEGATLRVTPEEDRLRFSVEPAEETDKAEAANEAEAADGTDEADKADVADGTDGTEA